MATLMVWTYQVDHGSEDNHTWNKVASDYKIGTHEELLFWRVINSGATTKDYFYSPHDYSVFSGIPMDVYKEQVDAWHEKYDVTLKALNITRTNINATIISNGRSYASFFPTDPVELTGSTAF